MRTIFELSDFSEDLTRSAITLMSDQAMHEHLKPDIGHFILARCNGRAFRVSRLKDGGVKIMDVHESADALLIAAATDMLEELKVAERALVTAGSRVSANVAREAIAKARGSSQ